MLNLIKYNVAKIMKVHVMKELNRRVNNGSIGDEKFNQKWIFIQGQCLSKGSMAWSWSKVLGVKWKWLVRRELSKKKFVRL